MTNAHDFGPSRFDLFDLLNQHVDLLSGKAGTWASYTAEAVLSGNFAAAQDSARKYDFFCVRAEFMSLRRSALVRSWSEGVCK